jgi:hypothetical protein
MDQKHSVNHRLTLTSVAKVVNVPDAQSAFGGRQSVGNLDRPRGNAVCTIVTPKAIVISLQDLARSGCVLPDQQTGAQFSPGTWSSPVCGNFSATSDIWHPYLSQYYNSAAAAIVITVAR